MSKYRFSVGDAVNVCLAPVEWETWEEWHNREGYASGVRVAYLNHEVAIQDLGFAFDQKARIIDMEPNDREACRFLVDIENPDGSYATWFSDCVIKAAPEDNKIRNLGGF